MNLIKKIFEPIENLYKKIKSEIKEIQRKATLRQQRIQYIKNSGQYICAIRNLNRKYKFVKIEPYQRYKRTCNSKPQLDNFNIDNHMLLTIEDSPDFFKNMVKAVTHNRKKSTEYETQFEKIIQACYSSTIYSKLAIDTVIDAKELFEIELKECRKNKIKDCTKDFTIELIVCYTSPQGRNEYTRTYKFNCSNIEYYLNEFQNMQKNKQSAVYQRQLMTPKLRYKIMKRDNFKCTICGRSQNDGAKLHVDHIKPVSKGGKTEESNLRTLCDMCNLGKSDSYDPYGLN